MMHERKSIDIVRDILHKHGYYDSDEVVVEEGRSSDGRINALLNVIPPELTKKRYPDFILRVKASPSILILIEVRSGSGAAEKHPNEDGTMLYSAALARRFDVLTIAIREAQGGQYRIEHFLQKCQDRVYRRTFGNRLLTLKEYLAGVKNAPHESRPVSAKLIIGRSRKSRAVRTVVRTELYLMPPKFAHRFMDNSRIRMVRRRQRTDE